MGIKGAAIATVLAQAVSVILSVGYLIRKLGILIPERRHFRFDRPLYHDLFGQGLSMALMSSIVFMASIILQYAINGMGYLIIAGHTAARRLNTLFLMPMGTLTAAVSTFVSQNRGAGNRERIREGVRLGRRMVGLLGLLLAAVVMVSASLLMRSVSGSDSEIVIATGRRYLLWNAPFYFIVGILFVLRHTLQGLGEKILPLMSSVIELVLKTLFVIFLIPRLGYFGVIICEPVIWMVMTAQLALAYKKNRYMGNA